MQNPSDVTIVCGGHTMILSIRNRDVQKYAYFISLSFFHMCKAHLFIALENALIIIDNNNNNNI